MWYDDAMHSFHALTVKHVRAPPQALHAVALALLLPEREGVHDHLYQAADQRDRVSRARNNLPILTFPVSAVASLDARVDNQLDPVTAALC